MIGAIRKDLSAIVAGLLASLVVAALIDGREILRVRAIAAAYGRRNDESLIVFALVLGSTLMFTAAVLIALSLARGDKKALVVCLAPPLSLFASLPIYWYVYRDAPPGWHINIAEEHRWAQPAGVAAALIAYGMWHIALAILRMRKRAGV